MDKYITKNNIKDVIPDASFYDLTTKISNVLTDHINKIAFEALSEISVDTLYAQIGFWGCPLLCKLAALRDNTFVPSTENIPVGGIKLCSSSSTSSARSHSSLKPSTKNVSRHYAEIHFWHQISLRFLKVPFGRIFCTACTTSG